MAYWKLASCCLFFLPKNWTNLDKLQIVGFLTDFGRFCLKCIMHACRLGWPFGARTATLDGRSSRRPLTGDKEKYHYKDHKGSKEDIEEKKQNIKSTMHTYKKLENIQKYKIKIKNFFLPTDHNYPAPLRSCRMWWSLAQTQPLRWGDYIFSLLVCLFVFLLSSVLNILFVCFLLFCFLYCWFAENDVC